jgi:hypothetical protein
MNYPAPLQHLKYGTNQPGIPYRSREGGTIFRVDTYTPNGGREWVNERRFAASLTDQSPPHSNYPTGYDPECSCCWLNASHTVDRHNRCGQD